jgi:hypothetical protein
MSPSSLVQWLLYWYVYWYAKKMKITRFGKVLVFFYLFLLTKLNTQSGTKCDAYSAYMIYRFREFRVSFSSSTWCCECQQFRMAGSLETLCGQAYGAKKYQKLGIYTYCSIISLILVCLPISFLWMFIDKLLILLGQDNLQSPMPLANTVFALFITYFHMLYFKHWFATSKLRVRSFQCCLVHLHISVFPCTSLLGSSV